MSTMTIQGPPCWRLRWKGLFLDTEADGGSPATSDDMYWCTQTKSSLGPDARPAKPAACQDGRGCFARQRVATLEMTTGVLRFQS